MNDTTPAKQKPLVPAGTDLRDFPYVPIFRARLFASRFHHLASDAEWRAGVTLWLKSWDQVPAGSLPDDDRELCQLAELGRDLRAWKKVRKWALYQWERCEDGRLYHRVVAETVVAAIERREANRQRTAAAREAYAKRATEPATERVAERVTGRVTATKEKEKEKEKLKVPREERTETPSARASANKHARANGHANGFEKNSDDPVGRSAPLRADGAPLKAQRKEALRQKLMRFVHATKPESEVQAAFLGLMGEDQQHSAQWWLDTLDIEMRAKKWSDTG